MPNGSDVDGVMLSDEPDGDADDPSAVALATPPILRTPINRGGIDEDAVAMPGNGQASIDDLEAAGQMTPDLLAKARPETAAYLEGPGAEGEQEQLFRLLSASGNDPKMLEQYRRMAGQ
jgi:hypothetical protein